MTKIKSYTAQDVLDVNQPWLIPGQAENIIMRWISQLPRSDYFVKGAAWIHKTATVEDGAILKGPCVIGPNVFVAAYAYLRGGVWLDKDVIIGPACEIKTSFLFSGSKAAHFNFVGDSIIGHNVNIEAGAIIANHRNEWQDKEILCQVGETALKTGVTKFGALIGDNSRIGANAVLAPGTILSAGSIVKRCVSIDQTPMEK
jgi:bifunctional N-acetylglucosamine-1-phosphate-uridyltransferase/glucosamine-1-phosphate-acetyltransferase GlmU-like protein